MNHETGSSASITSTTSMMDTTTSSSSSSWPSRIMMMACMIVVVGVLILFTRHQNQNAAQVNDAQLESLQHTHTLDTEQIAAARLTLEHQVQTFENQCVSVQQAHQTCASRLQALQTQVSNERKVRDDQQIHIQELLQASNTAQVAFEDQLRRLTADNVRAKQEHEETWRQLSETRTNLQTTEEKYAQCTRNLQDDQKRDGQKMEDLRGAFDSILREYRNMEQQLSELAEHDKQKLETEVTTKRREIDRKQQLAKTMLLASLGYTDNHGNAAQQQPQQLESAVMTMMTWEQRQLLTMLHTLGSFQLDTSYHQRLLQIELDELKQQMDISQQKREQLVKRNTQLQDDGNRIMSERIVDQEKTMARLLDDIQRAKTAQATAQTSQEAARRQAQREQDELAQRCQQEKTAIGQLRTTLEAKMAPIRASEAQCQKLERLCAENEERDADMFFQSTLTRLHSNMRFVPGMLLRNDDGTHLLFFGLKGHNPFPHLLCFPNRIDTYRFYQKYIRFMPNLGVDIDKIPPTQAVLFYDGRNLVLERWDDPAHPRLLSSQTPDRGENKWHMYLEKCSCNTTTTTTTTTHTHGGSEYPLIPIHMKESSCNATHTFTIPQSNISPFQ